MSSSISQNGTGGCLEHIYERSQKLTEALYRVTDLFSDSEPLKWMMRRDGLHIFEALLQAKTAPVNERLKGLSQTAEKIKQLVRVFELAASGSFISDANFQVLKKRYLELADYLSERKAEILPELSAVNVIGHESIGQLTIGQGATTHPTTNDLDSAHARKSSVTDEEKINKGEEDIIENPKIKNELRSNDAVEINHADTDNNNEGRGMDDNQDNQNNQIDKGDRISRGGNGNRRQEIISLIKEKDWVSVGELAEAFRGKVGEKTLQRDLVSMADEGLLLKEGEKRWRRYKLSPSIQPLSS